MTRSPPPRVVLVTGLKKEARILGGGAEVIVGGGDSPRLTRDLETAVARGASAFLSMGVAGGLSPGLTPGTVIIATAVLADDARIATAPAWTDRLNRAIPEAKRGDIAGVDRVMGEVSGKAALHRRTGAAVVDMESHIVARIAQRHRIPFAVVRVIADPAERPLPIAAQAGFSPGGGINVAAVIRQLVISPGQLPALIGTARDAGEAFRGLARCRLLIGPGFSFPDLGELVLDVP